MKKQNKTKKKTQSKQKKQKKRNIPRMLSGIVLWKKSASSPENNMAEEGKVIKHFKFVFIMSFFISLVNAVWNNYIIDTFLP